MKTLLLALISALLLVASEASIPPRARCAYCIDQDCFSSGVCGGAGCVCLKTPGAGMGHCMSIR
jgi:hypothetical protein